MFAAYTQQKPDITPPSFTTVQVSDIFQRLVRKRKPLFRYGRHQIDAFLNQVYNMPL